MAYNEAKWEQKIERKASYRRQLHNNLERLQLILITILALKFTVMRTNCYEAGILNRCWHVLIIESCGFRTQPSIMPPYINKL